MGFRVSSLWKAPELNPVTNKALSIPILNPFNKYGRVFFFCWFGFFVGSWSWYAFPPLTTVTIRQDLNLSDEDIATGNTLALVSTCIARATAGFFCDRFGPRWTYVGILLIGALPTALAGAITDAGGLIAVRCFTGVLGAGFIPCEVWATGFFDKRVVGAATAIAAGWGNAGGGITYFLMPAVFNSLVSRQHLTAHVAWRVTFIVPFLLILTTAILLIFCCPDTPTGPWSARHRTINQQLSTRDMFVSTARPRVRGASLSGSDDKIELKNHIPHIEDAEEAGFNERDLLTAASWELVQKPTVAQTMKAIFSLHTLALVAPYFCSFGTELAIMSFLGAYYFEKWPYLGQTGSGNWAAMFGLLNFISRPSGGLISDAIYRPSASLWGRKAWFHTLGFISGIFCLIVGFLNSDNQATMFGLFAAVGFFTEAGNGAGFSLVPHVHPSSNGIISGLTGASGTLGGVIFTTVARHYGVDYWMTLRFIGIWTISANLLTCWIPPIPKGQLGGR